MPTRQARRARFAVERLEDRLTPAAAFSEFVDPHPVDGNAFGDATVVLPNGNVVITSPDDDIGGPGAGAVYLFNGATGALISSLRGASAGDNIGTGGITILPGGNFLVLSPHFHASGGANAGAVTFGSATAGVNGPVSAANSLVGSAANDHVGDGTSGVMVLSSGNYLVVSPSWDNGAATDAGAVTFGRGTTGVAGTISAANSLVGSTAKDKVGESSAAGGVVALTNGNYVVGSPFWDNGAVTNVGAATFGSGTAGVRGTITAANSLVGTVINDLVGEAVTALTNGNYVVSSRDWNNGAVSQVGAATFGNGSTGITGSVTPANSLVGSTAQDSIGLDGVTALANGNYVVCSGFWDNGAVQNIGAATFGSGTTGVTGPVSAANSLVGSVKDDNIGLEGAVALPNGNYVVVSPGWKNGTAADAGAVTLGSGAGGTVGPVSAANSLVGARGADSIGSDGVVVLPNGNYLVRSFNWHNGAVSAAGAVTFGRETTGVTGPVSAANSLVGSKDSDSVGADGITILPNGNYVVRSLSWDNGTAVDVGAVSFGSGTMGISGTVSAANSLVGSKTDDGVGSDGITILPNGNYLVRSSGWSNAGGALSAGAVTFGSGTAGLTGTVSAANSLVGSSKNDLVGADVVVLANGNYVIPSPFCDNGAVSAAGAVTFGSGTAGVAGTVSAANSLVGSKDNDRVGVGGITALANGNYVVDSQNCDNGAVDEAGAVTFGSGTTGVHGPVSAANSLVGFSAGDEVGVGGVVALSNGNYVILSPGWHNGGVQSAGAATFCSGTTGVTGAISPANSLVGSVVGDTVGFRAVALRNGNYVVVSDQWDNGGVANVGAVTFGSGTTGVVGPVTPTNSLVGTTPNDQIGDGDVIALTNGNYVVLSPFWHNGAAAEARAATFGSGTTGVTGPVSAFNSALGQAANTGLQHIVVDDPAGTFLAPFVSEGGGRVRVGSQTTGFVPNVTLSVSTHTGAEAASTLVTVTATASSPVTGNQSVTVTVTGAGISPGDFTLTSSTIIIPDGQTTGSVGFVVANDTAVEPTETATLTISNPSAGLLLGAVTAQNVTIVSDDGTPPPSASPQAKAIVVGGSADGTAAVFVPSGGRYGPTPAATLSPFGRLPADVRVATADVDGDGTPDTVLVTGPGTPLRIAVVSGADNATVLVTPFDPFGGSFLGGGYVAAGDLDGDGKAEFVVTPDQGGGPRVTVLSRNADGSTAVRANFLGIDDTNFRGGARAAVGDVNGDGVPDVVVAAGFGGGPRTAIFTGQSVLAGAPARLVSDFFAFPGSDATNLRNGSFVAAGDIDGDGYADLVFGGGPGGAPRVFILSGALVSAGQVDAAQAAPVANFFAGGNPDDRGGARVAVTNSDGDGRADVAVGSGAGRPAKVRVYLGKDFAGGSEPPATDLDVLGGAVLADGVYVG